MDSIITFFNYFFEGLTGIFEGLFPNSLNDEENLRGDWEQVGDYIGSSMDNIDTFNEENDMFF